MPKIRTPMQLYKIETYLAKRFERAYERPSLDDGRLAIKAADRYVAFACRSDDGPRGQCVVTFGRD